MKRKHNTIETSPSPNRRDVKTKKRRVKSEHSQQRKLTTKRCSKKTALSNNNLLSAKAASSAQIHTCLQCKRSHTKCSGFPNCTRCKARNLPCYVSSYHEALCERMHLVTKNLAERFLVDLFIPSHMLKCPRANHPSSSHNGIGRNALSSSASTHVHQCVHAAQQLHLSKCPHRGHSTHSHNVPDFGTQGPATPTLIDNADPLNWFTRDASPEYDSILETFMPNTSPLSNGSSTTRSPFPEDSHHHFLSFSPNNSPNTSPNCNGSSHPPGSFAASHMHSPTSRHTTSTTSTSTTILKNPPPPPPIIYDYKSPEWNNFWKSKTILPRTGQSIDSGPRMIKKYFRTSIPVSMWIVEGGSENVCPITKREGELTRRLLLCNDAFAHLVQQPKSLLLGSTTSTTGCDELSSLNPSKFTQEHVKKWLQWMPENHLDPHFRGSLKMRIGSQFYLQTFERHYNLIFCIHEPIAFFDDEVILNGQLYPATFTTTRPLTKAQSKSVIAKMQRILVDLLEGCRDKLAGLRKMETNDIWDPGAALKEVSFESVAASLE